MNQLKLPASDFTKKVLQILPQAKGLGVITHPILGKRIKTDFTILSKLLKSIWFKLTEKQQDHLGRYSSQIEELLQKYHEFSKNRIYTVPNPTWRGDTHEEIGYTEKDFEFIRDKKPHPDTGICKAYITLLNETMDCLLKTLHEINPKNCDETPIIKDMITFYHNCTIMGKVFNNL